MMFLDAFIKLTSSIMVDQTGELDVVAKWIVS